MSEQAQHSASQATGSPHHDLAFVDGAIAMFKAAMLQPDDTSAAAAPGTVEPACYFDVAAAVAVLVFHAYQRLMPDHDPALSLFKRVEIEPKMSLSEMIERRNQVAVALGQKAIS